MTKFQMIIIGLLFLFGANINELYKKITGKDISESFIRRCWKWEAALLEATGPVVKFTNCRSAITGEDFNPAWISAGPIPLISDQGFLIATHGKWDGKVAVRENEQLHYVSVDDNRFTDIFIPGTVVKVLACYPAYRPASWEHNGRIFENIFPNEPVPMMMPVVGNTIVYAPMPYRLALALGMI